MATTTAMTPNTTTPKNERTVKVLMFTVTEPWAIFLFNWSNVLVALGALFGFVGVIGIFAMGGAKEQFASERITANEASTQQAIAESDKAKEGAAQANARALEAQLALERFKAPRVIASEAKPIIISEMRKYRGTDAAIYILGEGDEPRALAVSIEEILEKSQWKALRWNWVGVSSVPGIFVVAKPGCSAEIVSARDALVAALIDAHVGARSDSWPGDWSKFGGMLNGPNPPAPTDAPLRIIVGSKPQ